MPLHLAFVLSAVLQSADETIYLSSPGNSRFSEHKFQRLADSSLAIDHSGLCLDTLSRYFYSDLPFPGLIYSKPKG